MTKRKPWVTTLVLVGIMALLAAYIFLVEAKREPPSEEGMMPMPAPLWEFEGGDITGITVTKDEQTIAVERSDLEWRMTTPEAGEADSGRLNGLVYRIAEMQFTRAMSDVGNLADFGLQKPEVQVTLVISDGMTINLGIGTENPRHTARYVQKAGDPLVYLVSTADVDGLLRLIDEPPYPPPNLLETPLATVEP